MIEIIVSNNEIQIQSSDFPFITEITPYIFINNIKWTANDLQKILDKKSKSDIMNILIHWLKRKKYLYKIDGNKVLVKFDSGVYVISKGYHKGITGWILSDKDGQNFVYFTLSELQDQLEELSELPPEKK